MELFAGHFETVDRDQECRRRVSEIIQSAGQLILGYWRLRVRALEHDGTAREYGVAASWAAGL